MAGGFAGELGKQSFDEAKALKCFGSGFACEYAAHSPRPNVAGVSGLYWMK